MSTTPSATSATTTAAPQIPASLPYLNRFQPLAYTLILLSISAFAYAEPNFPIFIIGSAALFLSWWLVEGPNGKPLPRFLINLGVVAASVGLYYEVVVIPEAHDIRQANLLVALGHFMGGILLCKLFERKNNRDYAQILTLTLLIMVSGAIVATASLFFAVLLACYLALGLYVVLLFHLRSETQKALAQSLVTVQATFAGDSPARIRKDIRYVAAWTSILLLSIAAAVFLLFPRTPSRNLLGAWNAGSTSFTTGFTDQVRMQDSVFLHPSETVVFEAKLEQDGGPKERLNLGSESYQPYFRGTVLDTYDPTKKEWGRSTSGMVGASVEYTLLPGSPIKLLPDNNPSTSVITQTYTLRNSTTTSLFTVGPALTFSSDQLRAVIFWKNEMLVSLRRPTIPLTYRVTSPFMPRYAGNSESPFVTPGDLGPARSGDGRITHHMVPEKITELAHSLVPELLPPAGEQVQPGNVGAIAKKFQEYLRSNYPYSLRFRVVNRSIDPTEDFLLNRKSIGGHCECFASAMVMLCRAVGINARMAAGYYGGEYNSLGGFYLVKEKDAHAWVEVFVPERGWATFDPSPSSGRTGSIRASTFSRWFQEVSQLVQKGWLSTVVAFDNTSRKYILNAVSGFFQGIRDWITSTFFNSIAGVRELLFGQTSPLLHKLYGFTILLVMSALIAWLARHITRRRSSQLPMILKKVDRKTQKQLAYDLAFFDDLLRILGKSFRRKHSFETPREYVNHIASSLGQAAGDAHWLIATFYDVRFGTLRVTPSTRERITASLQNVRRAIQNRA